MFSLSEYSPSSLFYKITIFIARDDGVVAAFKSPDTVTGRPAAQRDATATSQQPCTPWVWYTHNRSPPPRLIGYNILLLHSCRCGVLAHAFVAAALPLNCVSWSSVVSMCILYTTVAAASTAATSAAVFSRTHASDLMYLYIYKIYKYNNTLCTVGRENRSPYIFPTSPVINLFFYYRFLIFVRYTPTYHNKYYVYKYAAYIIYVL